MTIETVGIVGAGTMGTGIAINLAQHGLRILVADQSRERALQAGEAAATFFQRAVEKGRMNGAAASDAVARIQAVVDLADFARADLVIEAVFEDFDLKAELFRQLSGLLPPATLVATNTSCLRVGDLQAHMAQPGRFLGLHYFSPAAINPVVEVVQGAATDAFTIDAALTFCSATGKQPLRCKDGYGFAINRFFCPYTNEAARLLDESLGDPASIDALASEAVGAVAGPFAVMNLIKPRINLHAIRNLSPLGAFYAPARSMTEVGDADASWTLGQPVNLPPTTRALVLDRLRAGTFLPVLQALDEAVATAADIDLGARMALRFERPPVALMDALGRAEVRRIVAPLAKAHGIGTPRSLENVGNLGVC